MTADEASNSKRIAKNTAFLYARMFFSLIVSFFTAGIVLNTLGVVDYGINNVVGGLVSMFTLVSGSLSASASRFITYELGKNDPEKLQRVFSTSVYIHIGLALLVFLLLETVGLWFLNTQMVIPEERLTAAHWVFQCSILSFMINLVSVPYNADIMAHEHMDAYAYISILDVVLRLAILFVLMVGEFDKLILYGLLQLAVALIIQTVYMTYCRRRFAETRLTRTYDRPLVAKMVKFSGWNFIGASSAVGKDQGVNMLINVFCGPAINAARGIGVSVNGMINGFASNLLSAINPQITKNYATGNYGYMMKLIYMASKYAFFLLFVISLPIFIETGLALEIWLRNVPDYAVIFVQLILCLALIDIVSNPLVTVMLATGRIKWYQIIVGGAQLLNLPASYVLLKLGFPPQTTVVAAIAVSILCMGLRLYMLRRMIGLSARTFLKKVIRPILEVAILAPVAPYVCALYIEPGNLVGLIEVGVISLVSCICIIYAFGLEPQERELARTTLSDCLKKIRK